MCPDDCPVLVLLRKRPLPKRPAGKNRRASLQESIKANAQQTALDLGKRRQAGIGLDSPRLFHDGRRKGGDDEKPVHKVTLTKPFYIGKYKVTQPQWEALMGSNPSSAKDRKTPWSG